MYLKAQTKNKISSNTLIVNVMTVFLYELIIICIYEKFGAAYSLNYKLPTHR